MQLYTELGLRHHTFSLFKRPEGWTRLGQKLLTAICAHFRVEVLWVLTGEGPKNLPEGAAPWVLRSDLPLPLQGWVRGQMHGAKVPWVHPSQGPRPVRLRRCRNCGAPTPKDRGKRRFADGCAKPRCQQAINRMRWEDSLARKAAKLGYVPCRYCWTEPRRPGRSGCAKCAEKYGQTAVQNREERRAAGLCLAPGCTNPLRPGKPRCHMHHEIEVEHFLSILPLLRPPAPTREYWQATQRRRLAKCRSLWICVGCSQDAEPGHAFPMCKRHRRISNSRKRIAKRRRRLTPRGPLLTPTS